MSLPFLFYRGGDIIEKKFQEYVIEYQAGDKNKIIEKLIEFKGDSGRWYCKDSLMDYIIFKEILPKYYGTVEEEELYDVALNAFIECMEKANVNKFKDNKSCISFFRKNIINTVRRFVLKETGYDIKWENGKYVYPQMIKFVREDYEDKTDDEDDLISNFDYQIVNKWKSGYDELTLEGRFLKFFNKIAKKVLTEKQFSVYRGMMNSLKEENDTMIAKKLKMDRHNFYSIRNNLISIIKEYYQIFIEMEEKLKTSNTKKIAEFITEIKKIKDVSGENFPYFQYLVNFLKANYHKGEQYISFEELIQNKNTIKETVFDILVNFVTKDDYQILFDILENDKSPDINEVKKKEIFLRCAKGMVSYLKINSKNVYNIEEYIFNFRDVEKIENDLINIFKNGKSKYTGVFFMKKQNNYKAIIKKNNGKTEHIGTFENEIQAARAYDARAKELGKKRLNNV
jgi:hypothetical protein